MTALAIPTVVPPLTRPPLRRWTGAEFDRLADQGVFDGQRVELIDGQILELPPMNDPHAQAVQLCNYALLPIFTPTTTTIRVQSPMRLGESRPFPDLVVASGTPREVSRHPETALLVVEVSDTSLEFDREKASLYAQNGLPEYWIVNIGGRCVEVHRNPLIRAADPRYGDIRVYGEEDSISPLAAPGKSIRVADLLP